MASMFKRLLLGRPMASAEEQHQRLPKTIALAVFASDAISSTAYATEEILLVLVPVAGLDPSLSKLVPIAIVVVILLAIVTLSYRQTIFAYPSGGGSYVVSRENLGETPALVAGASLMVDYILTVAVSVSAGVAAILSAVDNDTLREYRVLLCCVCIAIMTVANLRGIKESGRIFAVPTYVYVFALGALLSVGLFRSFTGSLDPMAPDEESLHELMGDGMASTIGLLLLLRAFSSGAIALSGVEAISNGVPSFRKNESKNAATTLVLMSSILGIAFLGISVLGHRLKPTPSENETLLSIMGGAVFGEGSFMYYLLQISTFGILILAANTAFNGFPAVTSIIARDGFLPRQLANRGDRLVFSNGILVLAGAAALLIVAFGGKTSLLIHLYAVGVFTGFTLSQAGMVRRHRRLKEPGWRASATMNAVGCVATGLVLLIVVVSKFTVGAWLPAIVIPVIVFFFRFIKNHYRHVEKALAVPEGYRARRHTHTVVVLVARINKATLGALTYARSLAPDRLIAMSVVSDAEQAREVQEQWRQFDIDIPLRVVASPYRELTGPVVDFIDELDAEYENDIVTVILPEFVLTRWWEQLLHNQSALLLKARLLFRKNTVVVSVPYHIEHGVADVPGDVASEGSGQASKV